MEGAQERRYMPRNVCAAALTLGETKNSSQFRELRIAISQPGSGFKGEGEGTGPSNPKWPAAKP